MHARHAATHGFTLIELLVALAIAGILAMVGAPAMGSLLAHTREAATETAVFDALQHARTAAVMHNARVLMCPSDDGHHCQTGDDWQHGWIVARDADHDGQPDAGTAIIATHAALAAGTRVVTSSGRNAVAFHPDGSATGSNVRFTICHARESTGKSVVVANTGHVHLADVAPTHLAACLAGMR